MAHIHAELMMQYAQDAMEHDEPWELWESFSQYDEIWVDCEGNPVWMQIRQYRRKPKTRKYVLELPEPMREKPKKGEKYYYPHFLSGSYDYNEWEDGYDENYLFEQGLCFKTKEDAQMFLDAIKDRVPEE